MKRFINYKHIQPNRYQIGTDYIVTDSHNSDTTVNPRKDGYVTLRTLNNNKVSSFKPETLFNYTFTDMLLEESGGVILEEYPNYIVCENGDVFSLQMNRLLSTHKQRRMHNTTVKYDMKVDLTNPEGKTKQWLLHRLIATAFIPNPENKPEVNHIDGNPENNNVNNFEWVTHQENADHAVENRLYEGTYNTYTVSKLVYKVEYEKSYSTGAEAAMELGVANTNVLDCCKKNKEMPDEHTPPATRGGKVLIYGKETKAEKVPQEVPEYREMDIDKLSYKVYDEVYAVTKDGRLYNLANRRFNKLAVAEDKKSGNKYLQCSLKLANGKYKSTRFASLVAQVWLGDKPKGYIVSYKNGNKLDCSAENLEYVPQKATVAVPVDSYRLMIKEEVIETGVSNLGLREKYGINTGYASDTANLNKEFPVLSEYEEVEKVPQRTNGYVVRFG